MLNNDCIMCLIKEHKQLLSYRDYLISVSNSPIPSLFGFASDIETELVIVSIQLLELELRIDQFIDSIILDSVRPCISLH